MIITCTILKGRIAIGADYADGVIVNGAPERGGPAKIGGEHIAIDFDVIGERQIAFNAIVDLDSGFARSLATWPRPITDAIDAHCRAYANRHALRQSTRNEPA